MPLPRPRAHPQDHPEPLKGVRVPLAAQGGRGPGLEEGSREGTACRPLWPGPPGPPCRPGGHTSRVDVRPSCPRLPAAFVFLGLHKMAAAALRHFVCEAGGRAARRGRREGDHCPAACPEWPGRSPAPAPAPAWPWPRLPWAWHQRASWQGRPGTPALHPAWPAPSPPPRLP